MDESVQVTPPPPHGRGGPSPDSSEAERAGGAKKAWRKPKIEVIWDGLLRVESGPGVSGPGFESPTYVNIPSS